MLDKMVFGNKIQVKRDPTQDRLNWRVHGSRCRADLKYIHETNGDNLIEHVNKSLVLPRILR